MNVSFLVNEIHPCLQGEGPNIGTPSLLVRLHICNLRCSWCDTPYTHTFKSDKFKRIKSADSVKQIDQHKMFHIIFTGGEPTLQNIGLLARMLKDISPLYTFEVESNGTRIPHKTLKGFLESDYQLMQWNISPKFENANESIVDESLQHWANLAKNHPLVFFKFVIRKSKQKEDLKKMLDIINTFDIKPEKILLMAEGTTQKSQMSNIWLHDICLKYGFRLTPRLHILIFGAKRGV